MSGSSRSVIGVVVATLVVVGLALGVIVVLSSSSDTAIFDAEVGDCFELPLADDQVEISSIEVVDCTESHDAQIVGVGELNESGDEPYPSDAELFELVERACPASSELEAAGYGLIPIAPNERSWEAQAGAFACVAITIDGSMVDRPLDIGR